jgi:uracil-DNA glycosylase family 4
LIVTYTSHHPPQGYGYATTSSVVAPRSLPTVDVQGLATTEVGWPPQSTIEHTLEYKQPAADSRQAVTDLIAQYSNCARCHLSGRRNAVSFLKGNPYSPVALVGEGPGKDADAQGMPFVGRDGRLQDELFRTFGIDPMALAWMNLVGCRPCDALTTDSRAPKLGEMLACSERTWTLLAAIRPRVVICLGPASTRIFWDEAPDVWTWHRVVPEHAPQDWVMVGHARHPAYLARVIGMPSNYKEYAAARTFYGLLRDQMPTLVNTSAWQFGLRYLTTFNAPVVTK